MFGTQAVGRQLVHKLLQGRKFQGMLTDRKECLIDLGITITNWGIRVYNFKMLNKIFTNTYL